MNHPAYMDMSQNENIQVEYVENLSQQDPTSMDCGVYVAAFAEYLSSGEGIPAQIDAKMLRTRYGALLWDYVARKIDEHAMSDIEAPPKPVRPTVDYDKVETIDVT
ncbi:uncharacterized protein LOC132041953 [Lycium ferocissimum]|uniref:uncharacterized protein LOC132041953 n=1 Tax=Lycium ferocissimum TaxID=112874 RepID=UPI0028162988|nr:uncharacterized protein LOC132041953 [Lycium ferocissimum]